MADVIAELPKKLSHRVMVRSLLAIVTVVVCCWLRIPRRESLIAGRSHQVPLGKRAMMPGKIVRSNEILAHLGDDYFAWQSASSAVETIERKKKSA